MAKKNGNGDKKYAKGATRITYYKGKRMRETYVGDGTWEGRPATSSYKKPKMKPKTNYVSTRSKKGRPRKRKH